MSFFNKTCALLDKAGCVLCIISIGIMSAVTAANIFTRNVLNFSIVWAVEVARYLFVWATIIGGALVLNRNGLAATTIFVDRMPLRLQNALKLIVELIIIFFSAYCFVYGIKMCLSVKGQMMAGIPISKTWAYLALPVGFFLCIMFSLRKLFLYVKSFIGKGEIA